MKKKYTKIISSHLLLQCVEMILLFYSFFSLLGEKKKRKDSINESYLLISSPFRKQNKERSIQKKKKWKEIITVKREKISIKTHLEYSSVDESRWRKGLWFSRLGLHCFLLSHHSWHGSIWKLDSLFLSCLNTMAPIILLLFIQGRSFHWISTPPKITKM